MNVTQRADGNVIVAAVDEYGYEITREFTCPSRGGYVREYIEAINPYDDEYRQVSYKLGYGGAMMESTPESLLSDITRAAQIRYGRFGG